MPNLYFEDHYRRLVGSSSPQLSPFLLVYLDYDDTVDGREVGYLLVNARKTIEQPFCHWIS
jgi:hypothetical protein